MLGRKSKNFEIHDPNWEDRSRREKRSIRRTAERIVSGRGLIIKSAEGQRFAYTERTLPKQITESAMTDVIVEPAIDPFPEPDDQLNPED